MSGGHYDSRIVSRSSGGLPTEKEVAQLRDMSKAAIEVNSMNAAVRLITMAHEAESLRKEWVEMAGVMRHLDYYRSGDHGEDSALAAIAEAMPNDD